MTKNEEAMTIVPNGYKYKYNRYLLLQFVVIDEMKKLYPRFVHAKRVHIYRIG